MGQVNSMSNKIYFASDFHLGIPDYKSSLKREIKLVRWLDEISKDATEIYLMGDIFDFWFEYQNTIPKGYARLLGKLAEITDGGIPIHLFRGNHDMWAFHYLQDELHIQLHREPEIKRLGAKLFYLAHGDGLGPGDRGYKLIKKIFACRFNQWLFRWLHPDIGIRMALFWSRRSRYIAEVREKKDEERTLRLIEERITTHSKEILKKNPDLDFLIYGHYHYPLDIYLTDHTRQIVLGDWLTHFTYAEFDGEELKVKTFE